MALNIFATQDGSHSIYSEEFGVPYHSKYGAIQESEHVFIKAGLHHRLSSRSHISIFEMGFGSGLNCLLAWQVCKNASKTLYYEAVETNPLSVQQAEQLNYPDQIDGISTDDFVQLHQTAWNESLKIDDTLSLLKRQQSILEVDLDQQFDVVFFDAFAPGSQPELWEEAVFAKLYAVMNDNGVLVTYCAKGVVKRTLKAVGFTVEALPGPPGKREMTRAVKMV